MTSFQDLGLAEPILKALAEEGYDAPTPIQADAIPPVLAGRDLLGIAQTGTGKTAAFALPILHHLAQHTRPVGRRGCRVLVLSPTRELAGQIQDSFKAYGRHLKFTVTLAIGGVPIGRQTRALMPGVDVLVATPGRVIDLYEQGAVKFDEIEVLVLDEADRMLEVGFIHAIRAIIAKLPQKRQGLFFSATMPKEIADLANRLLRDPIEVAVTPVSKTADRIEQSVLYIDQGAKSRLLAEILKAEPIDRAIVFTRTKHGADRVVRNLAASGVTAEAIHGNKSQGQRERALGNFREGRTRILIATDIAARGIDVDGVSHVFNFDLPNIPESYVHRIGRTARAGASGIAISFCAGDERDYLRQIEKLTRQPIALATAYASTAAALAGSGPVVADDRDRREDARGGGRGRNGGGRQDGGRSNGAGRNNNGQRRSDGRAASGGQRNEPRNGADPRVGAERPANTDARPNRAGGRDEARTEGRREAPRKAQGAAGAANGGERSATPRRDHEGGGRRSGGHVTGARDGASRDGGRRDGGRGRSADQGGGDIAGVRFLAEPARRGERDSSAGRPRR
ncbi:DEAD/DEAH box helicase [Segnochrobactrum spirostomi]|uniref:DEAD-box ATP-dependent RNA helicase RhpA n=1 Tax=Segnochrobactrum spirostomi TaxID=2608987 RepID=A0A6A7XYH0_9HYPH|nr:DEAD/DEAH box helicase [Segnochrobactrum spirostomi]MQT11744.1 DEAD/DEAH box helicase [Segnochrobactrum spirostomi]